jgi:hypothetical protein
LVAFVGFGGVGMAAWFPLGPGEVYRPGPGARYVNQGVVGAVTVVPRDAFVGARPVARAMVVAPQREIMQAQVVGATAPIAPVRQSRLGSPAGAAAVRTPPARFVDRVARPAVVRAPAAGAARPRSDRPPAQVQERKAEAPKTEKKAVKKTEKKEERKENR